MSAVGDFFDDNLGWLCAGFVVLLLGGTMWLCLVDAKDPHIMLNKTEWTCSHSHTIYVPVSTGKVTIIMPEDICDTYRMNGY